MVYAVTEKRTCPFSKKVCMTEVMAKSMLKRIKLKKRKWRKEKRCYWCAGCNAWHLTSKMKGMR